MTSQTTIEKIKEISKKFDLAEDIVEASNEVQVISDDIIKEPQFYAPSDVMSLEIMANDFKFSRDTLKETIEYGRLVLEKATTSLLLEDDEKASNTMAFAELTTAVLNGVKVHSQLYKDFSTVLLNIKKINSENINITNNLNIKNTENISTVELIKRLKDSDKS